MVGGFLRARVAVPRRLVGGVLAAVLALTAVACDPTVLNDRMDDYGDDATSSTVNSGTRGASVLLSDGRVLFLANDAYTGALDANGNRNNANKVPNAAVIANGASPSDPLVTKLGSGNTAWLKPPTPGHTYTLLSAAAGAADIQVFAIERNSSGGTVGFRIVRVLQSTLAMSGTPVSVPLHSGGPEWGAHVLKNEKDGHWYVYGTSSTGAATYVARTPFGALTTTSSWRYWTGTNWSPSEPDARAIRDESGAAVAMYLTPAFHDTTPSVPDDPDRVVFLGRSSSLGGGNTFYYLSAERPQGPATLGSAAFTSPVESCGSGGTVNSSAITSHPVLSDDSATAMFSYARRCSVTTTEAGLERPRFFTVDLANAPALPKWRATWASGLARTNAYYSHHNGFGAGQTLRQIVHTSRGGGSTVRIRISNVYGTSALQVGAATVGISSAQNGNGSALSGTPTPVTFAGVSTVRVHPGQVAHSDAITLPSNLPSDHDVAISLYFPNGASSPSGHLAGLETSHVANGDKTGAVSAASFAATGTTGSVYFAAGLDVVDASSGGTVVTLGDSLTDGIGTSDDAEQRYPNYAYRDIAAAGSPIRHIANLGVSGRTLLPWSETNPYSATAAFDHEVLGQPGVRTVVIWIGINDLTRYKMGLSSPTLTQMRNGLQGLVDRGKAAGLRVILATITPMRGPTDPVSPATESLRQDINDLIRTGQFGAHDFVDFDAAVRDPLNHSRLQAAYSFGGGLHLTPAGYDAIANRVYLKRASL